MHRFLALFALALSACGGGGSDPSPIGSAIAQTPSLAPTVGPVVPFGTPWEQGLTATGVAWVGCVSYEPGRDGGGCFLQFQSMDKAGKFWSGATLNGGLVDATPGNKQGLLDIVFYVDDKPATIAMSGRWQGSLPGMGFNPTDFLSIGNPNSRPVALYLTPQQCPLGLPGNPRACVNINGMVSPLY